MAKRKCSIEKRQVFTCSNPVCGRIFSTPLKLMDLHQDDPYRCLVCPNCLTQVKAAADSGVDVTDFTVEDINSRSEQSRELNRSPEGSVAKCVHYLGFLSERSNKEKLSEDCMICKDIVKCMLKSKRD